MNSAESSVTAWNTFHPIGTHVRYWDGCACKWRQAMTAGPATLVRGVASVHLVGRKLPISLNHVLRALEEGVA